MGLKKYIIWREEKKLEPVTLAGLSSFFDVKLPNKSFTRLHIFDFEALDGVND